MSNSVVGVPAKRKRGRPRLADPVSGWRPLTVYLPPAVRDEFSRTALHLGRSRHGLVRECLETVGVAYARALAQKHPAGDGRAA